ncbi:hypothetical protein [Trujillonella humicola]|uniref:hypothetical protein n=1 Tax=Trujillonella humicola TaxID=3383699 RepID=UPI0039061762
MARAVMVTGERARPINEANVLTGEYVTVEEAVARGTAFMVPLRDGVIAWDADPDEGTEGMPPWVTTVERVTAEMNARCVIVGSGRPGHFHVYVVGPPGWSTADLAERFRQEADIPGGALRAANGIRPPLSPHRLGGAGVLVSPPDYAQTLAALTGRPGAIPLTPESRRILRHGDPQGKFTYGHSRSRSVMARSLALRYVNAGLGVEDYMHDMLDPRNRGGEKAQEMEKTRGLPETRKTLRNWYEEQRVRARDDPAFGHDRRRRREELALLHRTAETYPWPKGKASSTDRAVYEFLLSIADGIENPVVRHSTRSIADAVGRRRATVSASLSRLEERGLLQVVRRSTRTGARTYKLCPRLHVTDPVTPGVGGKRGVTGPNGWTRASRVRCMTPSAAACLSPLPGLSAPCGWARP